MTNPMSAEEAGVLKAEVGPDGKEWAKTEAGYAHVNTMLPRADGQGVGPYWYGWALREAFVAGAEWQEQRDNLDHQAALGKLDYYEGRLPKGWNWKQARETLERARTVALHAGFVGPSEDGPGDSEVNALDDLIAALPAAPSIPEGE